MPGQSGQSLGVKLVQLFAAGQMTGTCVHDLAAAAWDDGWGRQSTLGRKLVDAGSGGAQRSHVAKDVLAAAESEGRGA